MSAAPSTWPARAHRGYAAFVIHRLSGVALAIFLPLHFLALGSALNGAASLDGFLRWTDHPVMKGAETALVILLAIHLAGGLRLLALEFLGWRDWQKSAVTVAAGFSLATGLLFLLNLGL